MYHGSVQESTCFPSKLIVLMGLIRNKHIFKCFAVDPQIMKNYQKSIPGESPCLELTFLLQRQSRALQNPD